jgi:hypothetical protein
MGAGKIMGISINYFLLKPPLKIKTYSPKQATQNTRPFGVHFLAIRSYRVAK